MGWNGWGIWVQLIEGEREREREREEREETKGEKIVDPTCRHVD